MNQQIINQETICNSYDDLSAGESPMRKFHLCSPNLMSDHPWMLSDP